MWSDASGPDFSKCNCGVSVVLRPHNSPNLWKEYQKPVIFTGVARLIELVSIVRLAACSRAGHFVVRRRLISLQDSKISAVQIVAVRGKQSDWIAGSQPARID
jgi:hypothetical protein